TLFDIGAPVCGFHSGSQTIVAAFVFYYRDPCVADATEIAQCPLDFRRRNLLAANVGHVPDTPEQPQFAVLIPLAQVGQRGLSGSAVDGHAAITPNSDCDAIHRFTNAPAAQRGVAGA